MSETTKIAIFKGQKVRKTTHNNEWWFSVVDVVEALTNSVKPRVYWNAMKVRVKSQDGIELSTICRQLKLESADGKKYLTDCANTEGICGVVSGNARRELERKSGKKVSTKQNYLKQPQSKKSLKE